MYQSLSRRSFVATALGVALGHTTLSVAAKSLIAGRPVAPTCPLCNDVSWVWVNVLPIPPMHNLHGVDADVDVCPLCLSADGHEALTFAQIDALPTVTAYAVGGWDGNTTRYTLDDGRTLDLPRAWPHDYWYELDPECDRAVNERSAAMQADLHNA